MPSESHLYILVLWLGDGSGNVFKKRRKREREGRSLQMTAMKNLMKGLKYLDSSGKSFLSKLVLKHVLGSLPSRGVKHPYFFKTFILLRICPRCQVPADRCALVVGTPLSAGRRHPGRWNGTGKNHSGHHLSGWAELQQAEDKRIQLQVHTRKTNCGQRLCVCMVWIFD